MPDEVQRESQDLQDFEPQDPLDSLDANQSGNPLDRGVAPPQRWSAGMRYGTTGREQQEGESLDQHLAEEVSDPSAGQDEQQGEPAERPSDDEEAADQYVDGLLLDDGPDPRAGRLVAEDEGSHPAREADLVARDAGVDGGAATAEEAAVHVVEDDDTDVRSGAERGLWRARTQPGQQTSSGRDPMNAQQPQAAAAGTIGIGGDLTVSRIGFGAMRITGEGIWGEPASQERAQAALRRAVELGVNFIDTADSYGPEVSERLIAETLYPYPEDLVIATKGGLVRPGPGRWEPDGRPAHLREACEGSLRRLRVEQIALYQFHRPDPKVPLADSLGALADLKDEGKIRHIGLSNVTEDQLAQAQQVTPVVSVQNRYNVSDRSSDSMVDVCDSSKIVFLPWAPVQDAAGKPAVLSAARAHGVSVQQIVLAWLLARSARILPIPGSGSADHVAENAAAASLELTSQEYAAIAEAI